MSRVFASFTGLLLLVGSTLGFAAPRDLTFAERVAAQRAIERVQFPHRVDTQRPFDEVLPPGVLEGKVRRYLQESFALEQVWNRPITPAMLEAELRRIVSNTKFPDRLAEIFAALDRDPVLIQECFVRPVLSRRLAGEAFERDVTIHAAARDTAERLVSDLVEGRLDPAAPHAERQVIELLAESRVESALPRLIEAADAFVIEARFADFDGAPRMARYRIPKRTVSDWLAERNVVAGEFTVATVADPEVDVALGSPPCPAPDSWDPGSLDDGLYGRTTHSLHWTGTEMLVWGGEQIDGSSYGSGGLRYDPIGDSWSKMSTAGAPAGNAPHVAVWTGSVLFVWTSLNSGGRYDPQTDSWQSVSVTNAPTAEQRAAVWAGGRVIVWGSPTNVGLGKRYHPATDTWSNLTSVGEPSFRSDRSVISTGTEMIVWGGSSGPTYFQFGSRYNPTTDTWTDTTLTGAPNPRARHSAVWTGSRMLVWGGVSCCSPGSFPVNTGASYDPAANSWSPLPTTGAPSARAGHQAAQVANTMVVWGGGTATGGRLDVLTEQWLGPTSSVGAPTGSVSQGRAISTGSGPGAQMIVWGGNSPSTGLASGGRYDPASDIWSPTSAFGQTPRGDPISVWTGSEVLVWGGYSSSGTGRTTGDRYDPLVDAWTAMSPTGAPPNGNNSCRGAWTGEQLTVWCAGGDARYSPSTDTWDSISDSGALGNVKSATWAGSSVFVFGGANGNTARLYDPFLDRWVTTSTVNPPPVYPYNPILAWTGSKVIVWLEAVGAGRLYDPATNVWTTISAPGTPSTRLGSAFAWSGSELFIVGGLASPIPGFLNDGYRYDPIGNSWSAISMTGAPSGGRVVWTGKRLVRWGSPASGGVYDPSGNSWTSTTLIGAPPGSGPNLVWADRFLFVWGGSSNGNLLGTGSRYYIDNDGDGSSDSCDNCALVANADQLDADNDGAGDACDLCPSAPDVDFDHDGVPSCLDCDDTHHFVRPDAPEVCDSLNNDCNAPGWPSTAGTSDADDDGDNWRVCVGDCDDNDASSYPGAPELCDLTDNDCDTLVDEDPAGLDADTDTIGDQCDNCVELFNPSQADSDTDGSGDACDNCSLDANAAQEDMDGDGRGDACDNCLLDRNPSQSDIDSDTEGDACDLDDGSIVVFYDTPSSVEWQNETGFTSWNAYRGDLAVLLASGVYTQVTGSNPLADRRCGLLTPIADDSTDPAAGGVQFWLVTGVSGGVESGLGFDSTGVTRTNSYPCP